MSVIRVRDGRELLEIGFEDLLKYHGSVALMALAVGFRVQQAAFGELFGTEPPERRTLSVLSGHAGPGFRDAFEFITRAVTRGAYRVDTEYPQGQYDPYRAQGYAFVVTAEDGSAAEVVLKPDFLPTVFYDYLRKGRERTLTAEDVEAFDLLKRTLAEKALRLSQQELLTVRRVS